MAKKFSLDLVLIQGKTYKTGKREAFIIQKIGTDAADPASPAHLRIDNKPLGDIFQDVAPLHKINTRFVDLLDLGDLYCVVPPETEVIVEGPSGAKIRIKGELWKLEVGEVLPTDVLARFSAQPNHYMTFVRNTYSHGTDVALAVDAEVEVISLTPKTIETYVFAGLVEGKVSNYTAADGDLGVRFYLDNAPLDFITEDTKVGGIDLLAMPYPPAETTEHVGFSLVGSPIEVLGDHTLSVKVRNIKGAAISPTAGTSLIFDIAMVCEFKRKVT